MESKKHQTLKHRIGISFSLCAVALALSACDSRNSQGAASSPASAPTGEAIGPVIEAPAQPAAQEAPSEPAKLTQVYTGQPGEPSLATLKPFIGKYPQDGTDYLRDGILAERLKKLMGDRYDTLMKNLGTGGPLNKEGGRWSYIGNRQHAGGKEAAAVVIDPARNGLRVWLLTNGQQTIFTDAGDYVIPWTHNVQTMIANASGAVAKK